MLIVHLTPNPEPGAKPEKPLGIEDIGLGHGKLRPEDVSGPTRNPGGWETSATGHS